MSTAIAVARKGQPQTLENIVNKMNLKLGGFNHDIVLETPRLVMSSKLHQFDIAIIVYYSERKPGLATDVD